jgi:hypothetical protein
MLYAVGGKTSGRILDLSRSLYLSGRLDRPLE